MTDQQSTTEINEPNPYDKLDKDKQTAVDLRLEFWKYRYIGEKLSVAEQTVRTWFMEGGICREAYNWKKKQRSTENDEMFKEVRKELADMTSEAILVVKNHLKKQSLDAATKVLAINGISPIEKIELDDKNREKLDKINNLIKRLSDDITTVNPENKNTS